MLTEQKQLQQVTKLMLDPQNNYCADCQARPSPWISLDFGVFICINCLRAHHQLGPTCTRLRHPKMDRLKKQWLNYLQLGNDVINQYYEYDHEQSKKRKPNKNSDLSERRRYVQEKYITRKYAKPGEDDPVSRIKQGIQVQLLKSNRKKVQEYAQAQQIKQAKLSNKIDSSPQFDLLEDYEYQFKEQRPLKKEKESQIDLLEDSAGIQNFCDNSSHCYSLQGAGPVNLSINHISYQQFFGHCQLQKQQTHKKIDKKEEE